MKTFISSARIRSVLEAARTDKEVIDALRAHRINYRYSIDAGGLHIRIPCRHGVVRVYRKSAPVCSGPVPVLIAKFLRPKFPTPDELLSSTAWTDRMELI